MELETINKLYLELSQITTATTARETLLQKQLAEAQKDAVVLLKACRRAVLSLAAAAERMPEFKNDYDAMSAAIDAAIEKLKEQL